MTTSIYPTRSLLAALATAALAFTLTGCAGLGVNSVPLVPTPVTAVTGVSGTVYGGQQPVSGASIQVYTLNPTTLRGASTARLTPGTVVTSSNGSFSISVSYTCPAGDYAYIVATSGDAGGGTNTSLAMMTGIGPCSTINTSTKITINELTTVASVYALAPYMADYLHAGYAGGTSIGLIGISNAFAMLNSLANIATGTLPGATAPANATMPNSQITTVADVIAACVNAATGGGACPTLFAKALNGSGGQPSNTLDAALNIAHYPGQNVGPLFNLIPTVQPFNIGNANTPTDFTLPIKLTGGSLSAPYGIAIDASGDAWVTSETGTAVSEFSPTGAQLSAGVAATLSGAQGITIDPSGNIWVANTGANNVIKLTSGGLLSKTVTSTFLNAPVDIAADARGNIWVANFLPISGTYYVSEFNSSGSFQNGLATNINAPDALAVDPSGNVWISNSGSGYLAEYSKTFTQVSTGSGYTDNALQGPAGIAFDASGNAWVAGQGGPELSGFNNSGTSLPTTPVYAANGASLAQPTGVAVDGNGNIWVTNSTTTGSLAEFTAATGAPVTNAQGLGAPLSSPVEVAIDPSGNLWIANSGDNSVTLFVGLAAPTTTPLVARTQ